MLGANWRSKFTNALNLVMTSTPAIRPSQTQKLVAVKSIHYPRVPGSSSVLLTFEILAVICKACRNSARAWLHINYWLKFAGDGSAKKE